MEHKSFFNSSIFKSKEKPFLEKMIDAGMGFSFGILFLFLLNVFYDDIWFFTDDFEKVLDIFNFSIILGIILNFTRFFITSLRYKSLTLVISNTVFFIVAYKLYTVFPFDPNEIGDEKLWENFIRLVIIFTSIGVFIGTVVEFFKMLMPKL